MMRKETRCLDFMGTTFHLAATYLLCDRHTYGIAHTMAFVTPVVGHWLEREIAE